MNPPAESPWLSLTTSQKETLTNWLFEEKLTYPQILERARQEFGITASKSSLGRYRQKLDREQLCEKLADADSLTEEVNSIKFDVAKLRSAALKIIGEKFLCCARKPGVPKRLVALANMLLLSEQTEIQRQWLALAKDRFQFKASQAALKALPLVDEFTKASDAAELQRLEAIQRAIFGKELDGIIE